MMEVGNVPPHDLGAERAILGICMSGTNHILEATEKLKEEFFYKESNGIIFKTISSLMVDGDNVDMITVIDRLKSSGEIDAAGGIANIADMTSDVLVGFVDDYCRIIKTLFLLRVVIRSGSDIVSLAYAGCSSSEITDAVNNLAISLDVDDKNKSASLKDLMPKVIERIETIQNSDDIAGIPSGLDKLDNHTGGFKPSNLIYLAGRPGMGKTSFALKVMRSAAGAGKRCLFFSLEMTKERLATRLLSSESRVPGQSMERGILNQNDWPKITHATSEISNLDITIDDSSSLTAGEIVSKAKRHAIKKPVDLIVVDYMQLIRASGGDNRAGEISKISKSLLSLCKDLDATLIVVSQLNRECEKRVNKRPVASDLKESGSMEEDGDIVMLLYRDEVYDSSPDNPNKGIAEIIISKGRDVGMKTIHAAFIGGVTGFENLAEGV